MKKAKQYWVTDFENGESEIAFREKEQGKRILKSISKNPPELLHVVEVSAFEKLRGALLEIKYDLQNTILHRKDEAKDPKKLIEIFRKALRKKSI